MDQAIAQSGVGVNTPLRLDLGAGKAALPRSACFL
jgi:hypothetical protein